MKFKTYFLILSFFLIFFHSCKTISKQVSVKQIEYNDINIEVVIDTINFNLVLNVINISKDTLYFPDSFYAYTFSQIYEKERTGIGFENFIEIHHPPIPLWVNRVLPGHKIQLSKNEFNNDFLLKEFDMKNLKYFGVNLFYITLKKYHKVDKTKDKVSMERFYFETYSNICKFYINLYDQSNYVKKFTERWDNFKALNPNNY